MVSKIVCLFCVILIIHGIHAAKLQMENETSNSMPDLGDLIKKAIDDFKRSIDQMLATTVDILDAKQLQPVFQVVGDKITRVNKAYQDLTAPPKSNRLK